MARSVESIDTEVQYHLSAMIHFISSWYAAYEYHFDIAIALIKLKENLNAKRGSSKGVP